MASPTTAMADGGARLAGELATAKGTARGEERRKGGAHRAAHTVALGGLGAVVQWIDAGELL